MNREKLIRVKTPDLGLIEANASVIKEVNDYILGRAHADLPNIQTDSQKVTRQELVEIGGTLGLKVLPNRHVQVTELYYSGPDLTHLSYNDQTQKLTVSVEVPYILNPQDLLTYDGLVIWHTHPQASEDRRLNAIDRSAMRSVGMKVSNFFVDRDILKTRAIFYAIYDTAEKQISWYQWALN